MRAASTSLACAAVLLGFQPLQGHAEPSPTVKEVPVNGTQIRYIEQGRGAPVVFVHGGVSDHRAWEAQRETVAKRYRFIAIDQRYFGAAPWSDDGSLFSQATHIADLAAFVRSLNVGPVDVVGHSYGAVIALGLAVQHPELVRGLFINEPPLPSVLTDPNDQKLASEESKGLAAASTAAKAGDTAEATRLFVDWVNGQAGAFDALPEELKAMHLDNARTMPRQLDPPPPAPITCAQLAHLRVSVVITKGELTRPFFRVIAEGTHRCVAESQLVTIAGAQHRAPLQAPALFNHALLSFLAR